MILVYKSKDIQERLLSCLNFSRLLESYTPETVAEIRLVSQVGFFNVDNSTCFQNHTTFLPIRSVFLPLGGRKFQDPKIAHIQHPLKKAAEIMRQVWFQNTQVKVSCQE